MCVQYNCRVYACVCDDKFVRFVFLVRFLRNKPFKKQNNSTTNTVCLQGRFIQIGRVYGVLTPIAADRREMLHRELQHILRFVRQQTVQIVTDDRRQIRLRPDNGAHVAYPIAAHLHEAPHQLGIVAPSPVQRMVARIRLEQFGDVLQRIDVHQVGAIAPGVAHQVTGLQVHGDGHVRFVAAAPDDASHFVDGAQALVDQDIGFAADVQCRATGFTWKELCGSDKKIALSLSLCPETEFTGEQCGERVHPSDKLFLD